MYSDIMNNKVFYQHPNLMRTLGMHETVMEVMVNVLGEGESEVRKLCRIRCYSVLISWFVERDCYSTGHISKVCALLLGRAFHHLWFC